MSLWQRLTRGIVRQNSHPEWKGAVAAMDAKPVMAWQVTDQFHLKQGRSTGRLIFAAPDVSQEDVAKRRLIIFLKRHWRFPWWRKVLATLLPGGNWSPAAQEWANLTWAQSNQIPVPEPIAMGEFIGPRFGLRSFLAIRELPNMAPLHEAIPAAARALTASQFEYWKRNLIREMVRLTKIMHGQHRYHKDLYLCHFFTPIPTSKTFPAPSRSEALNGIVAPTLYLIDFHRLNHHRLTGVRWRIKDLAQLLYSTWSIPQITDKDRLRFFYRYLDRSKLSFTDKLFSRVVLWKATRYAKHNHLSPPVRQPSPLGSKTTSKAPLQHWPTEAAGLEPHLPESKVA
jgi:heptose I phosphotransferase